MSSSAGALAGIPNSDALPPPTTPNPRRGRRLVRRLALAAVVALLGLGGYTGYVGLVGSDQFIHPIGNTDCRTPLDRYGWPYEAINYDPLDDAALRSVNADMEHCTTQGAVAADEVLAADGVPIGGWYIPSAAGSGPTAPTVVLVHGWAANKSEVLKYAVPLHQSFNVVAFDLRNGGRSGRTATTFGIREQLDLEAIVDWLERTKHPDHLFVMGNSMGGATAVLAAATDPRIEALILDSTHARVWDVVSRRLEVDAGHPALPGTPAIFAGVWVRTGLNLSEADPVAVVAARGRRPLLLIHGTADLNDLPDRSAQVMLRAAREAGVPAELRMCQGGTHGKLIEACPEEWGAWSVEFLDRALGASDAAS